MEEKKTIQLNNSVSNVIERFAVKGKWKLIGSNSLRSSMYGSDYDVETDLYSSQNAIVKHFQKAFWDARLDKDVYIIDFKCGWDTRLVYEGDFSKSSLKKYLKNPLIGRSYKMAINKATGEKQIDLVRNLFILRWKPKDVENGRIKLIDGSYKSFEDCLLDPTVLKIDLIKKVGNQFCEVSENYYIKFKNNISNYPQEPSRKDIEKSFGDDIQYYSHKNSFKALKRLFSLYLIEGDKEKQINQMIDFFNGQIGYLNKIMNEFGILESLLIQDYRIPKWEDIYENLQFIKEQLSSVFEIPISEKIFGEIDRISEKTALTDIVTLKDYLLKKLNEYSRDFLRNYI